MEQWSILSNTLNYIQYDRYPKNYHSLGISAVTKCGRNPCTNKEERDMLALDFGQTPDILQEEYLNVYKGIQSERLSTTRFDKNSDLSTIYLGKADRSKNNKIKAEESFPISEQGYTMGKLLDSTECQILLDTGAIKSFVSKSYYMHCKSLHSLPEFTSKTQWIQVGNGQFVSVLFIIPVIVDIYGQRFEIYTLVSEIHENVDLVLGIKNVVKLEGVIKFARLHFQFLEQIFTHFSKRAYHAKTKRTEIDQGKSTIYRWDIRSSNYQNIR